jgi:Carboxypeptidase regulatory-like domain
MAYSSSQASAALPASRARAGGPGDTAKALWDVTWLPLLLFFGFLLCYALPFHAPTPHDLKVAVAGPVNASQISAGLQEETAAAFTPVTAGVSAGASSVTVAAGAGAAYQPGQVVGLYGGPGTSEQNQSQSLTISSITPGQGSGGGDLITFTGPVNSAYTQISSTGCSSWFCNYPTSAGAYLTPSYAGQPTGASGAFDVVPVQDDWWARQEVSDQAVQAAYVVNGGQATLYTAGADGQPVQWAVIRAFSGISQQQHLNQNVIDLVPATSGDPTATGMFWLSYAWNIVPLLLALMLMRATKLSRSAKLMVIVGMGAFASIAGFLIGYGLGIVPGQALAILFAFLNFEAVALVTYGLLRLAGRYGTGLAIILFLLLSIPSSGGPVPYQMVSIFFSWLHPVLPLGNLIDAMRSIFYFDGTNMIRPTLVLVAWIAAGAALITASALLPAAGQPRPPAHGPGTRAADAEGRAAHGEGRDGLAIRELPAPAATAVPSAAIQPPAGAATPPGNGADGFGSPRPPMLFGRVTDAGGAPIPAASVTIIDADGRQLLRTTTERHGRYAADGLPEGLLTVLVSAVGRMPVATRVTLTGDLPARQDFVIPDSTQGITPWAALHPTPAHRTAGSLGRRGLNMSRAAPGAHGRVVRPMGPSLGGGPVGWRLGQRRGGAGVWVRACRSASYPAP